MIRQKMKVVFAVLATVAVFLWAAVFVAALWLAPDNTSLEDGFAREEHRSAQHPGAKEKPGGQKQRAKAPKANPGRHKTEKGESSSASAARPQAEVKGENITVIGDSVIAMVDSAIKAKWPGAVVDGEKNRSCFVIDALLQKHIAAGTLRHYVVLGVANNGPITPEKIDGWVNALGPQRVLILVTGHGTARTTWIPKANAAIADAVKRYPNRVLAADWFSVAEAHPEGLYRDRTHPNPAGTALFVNEVERVLTQAADFAASAQKAH